MSPDLATEAVYRLPADLGPTQLRVVVACDGLAAQARLWLSYDGNPPLALRLVDPVPLTGDDYAASRPEAGLAALHWQQVECDAGTLGGPFAMHRVPAPLVDVATAELAVPRGVRQIRLRAESLAAPLQVGLQYRSGRSYELTETAYLDVARRAGDPFAALCATLQAAERFDQVDEDALQELRNHWLPLVRWLNGQREVFETDLARPAVAATARLPPMDTDPSDRLQRARAWSRSGDWLPALECWSELLRQGDPQLRCEALRGRVQALEMLQEPYLVERELRGLLCFDTDPAVRAMADRYLQSRYLREGDEDGLQRLAAVVFLRDPSIEHLRELTAVLTRVGQWDLAMSAAMGLPAAEQEPVWLLQAASQLRWWQVFDRAWNDLPEGGLRCYWEGIRQLHQGAYEMAEQQLDRSGPSGESLARHIRWGRQINRQLRQADPATRLEGILAWERWQSSQPGRWIWQLDETCVTGCAGTAAVYSPSRDLYSQYYRCGAGQPLQLDVQGPIGLRFEARPLHAAGSQGPLDGEIVVRGAGRESWFAINGNRPSAGLQMVDDEAHLPGYEVSGTLQLGPGRHELQLAADGADVLVRFYARRPACPLPVLPPLNVATMQAVQDGCYGAVRLPGAGDGGRPGCRGLYFSWCRRMRLERSIAAVG